MASELRRPANPNRADDKDDLRQHQIEQAKFLFQRRAARFDLVFDGGEICLRNQSCRSPTVREGYLANGI